LQATNDTTATSNEGEDEEEEEDDSEFDDDYTCEMNWDTGLYRCVNYDNCDSYDAYPYDTDVYEEDDCYYDTSALTWYCYDYSIGDYVYAWISVDTHEFNSSNLYVSIDSYDYYDMYYDSIGNEGLLPYGQYLWDIEFFK